MFQCKICLEKNKRIEDLKEQIELLKKLAFPNNNNANAINVEANSIMHGSNDIIDLTPEELARQQDIIQEQNALLYGTY